MSSRVVLLGCGLAAVLSVAGCSSGADGTPAAQSAVATVTTTAPPTATGAPVTGTPTGTATGGSGGAAGSGAAGGSGGNGSGLGLCTPTVMTFVVGQENGAAGTQYFPVIATNASQQSCVTTGYPGVALLDGSGNQYAQASRDTSEPVTTIVVEPGQKIAAIVGVSDVPSGSTGQCPTSSAFLFTLPDNTDSTTLQRSAPSCSASVQPFMRYTGS